MAVKKKPKKVAKKKAKKKGTPKKKAAAHVAAKAVQAIERQTNAVTYPSSSGTTFWRRERYHTLREFWPFYLNEHAFAANRTLHFIGSTIGIIFFAVALATGNLWLILLAFASGYAFAWVGHFAIEKNRPATFKYPIKSFLSDWRLWYAMLTGRVRRDLKKYGIESK